MYKWSEIKKGTDSNYKNEQIKENIFLMNLLNIVYNDISDIDKDVIAKFFDKKENNKKR